MPAALPAALPVVLKAPPLLQPGERVALFSPASHLGRERADLVADALNILQDWDLNVAPLESAERFHLYLAGQDRERAEEFERLYCDPGIRALFATRGGYGTPRMLPYLDAERIAAAPPKPVIGFSDITALHIFLHMKAGLGTIHGPCLAPAGGLTGPAREQNLAVLHEVLFEGKFPGPFPLQRLDRGGARSGTVSGRLLGGSLTLVAGTIGTPWELDTRGAILVLEDVDEAPYRIDRMVTHLRTAGKFEGLSGIVLGQFHRCDGGRPELLEQVLQDLFAEAPFPVATGLPVGHGDPNYTLPLGARAVLSLTGDGAASLSLN